MAEGKPGLKPRVCAMEGCGARATHLAGLVLRWAEGGEGSPVLLDLPLCKWHSHAQPGDLVEEDGWERLLEGCRSVGLGPPNRALTLSAPQPIDETPDAFRGRYEP